MHNIQYTYKHYRLATQKNSTNSHFCADQLKIYKNQ